MNKIELEFHANSKSQLLGRVGLLFQLMDDALKTLSFIRHRQFDADTLMSTLS